MTVSWILFEQSLQKGNSQMIISPVDGYKVILRVQYVAAVAVRVTQSSIKLLMRTIIKPLLLACLLIWNHKGIYSKLFSL